MTEKHDVVPQKPQKTEWSLSVDDLYTLIIKRMVYASGRKINKVVAAQVYTALMSVDLCPTDEEARQSINPMVLFEVATKIDNLIEQYKLSPYVFMGESVIKRDNNEAKTKPDADHPKRSEPDTGPESSEEHQGDSLG